MKRSLLLTPDELKPIPVGPWEDSQLEAARKILARDLTDCLRALAEVDQTEARRRLASLSPPTEDEYLELTDAERETILDVTRTVCEGAVNLERANDAWLILQALASLAAGETGPQVKARWQSAPWPVRTEILARFSWALEQREAMQKGHKFTASYQGVVTEREVDDESRKIDKEHYQLIGYLHGLARATGDQLVWVEKGETPDFVLEDDKGCPAGAEMGEAPLSQQWADEQDARTQMVDTLRPWLVGQGRDLHIFGDTPWILWRSRLPDVQAALTTTLAAAPGKKEVPVADETLALSAELKSASKPGRLWIYRTQDAADLARAAQEMAAAICVTVSKKLVNKNGNPRKLPSVRPCDLVLYPNGDGWPDPEQVRRLAAKQLPPGWKRYFDRIWMSSDQFFGRLG